MKSARNLGTHLVSRSTAPTVNKRDLVSVTGRCCGIDLRPTGASSVGSVSAGWLAGWLSLCLSVCCLFPSLPSINQPVNLLFVGVIGARTHFDGPVPVPIFVHTLGTLHCNCDPSVPYLPYYCTCPLHTYLLYIGTYARYLFSLTVHVTFPSRFSISTLIFLFSRLSLLQRGPAVRSCNLSVLLAHPPLPVAWPWGICTELARRRFNPVASVIQVPYG